MFYAINCCYLVQFLILFLPQKIGFYFKGQIMKYLLMSGFFILNSLIFASEKEQSFVKEELDQYEVIKDKSGRKELSRTPSPAKLQVFIPEGQHPFSAVVYMSNNTKK